MKIDCHNVALWVMSVIMVAAFSLTITLAYKVFFPGETFTLVRAEWECTATRSAWRWVPLGKGGYTQRYDACVQWTAK